MKNFNPVQSLPEFSKEDLIGKRKFMETEPTCPGGGTYIWIDRLMPRIEELMIRYSNPDHAPTNHENW